MKPPVSRNARATKRPGVPVSRIKQVRPVRESAPIGAWFSSMSLSYLTVTISAMVVIGGFMLSGPIGQLYNQQQKIADLKAQVAQAKLDLTNMTTERSRWQDPVYIRAQARDRLYYVMPGEISYLVMGTDGLNLSDTSGTVGAKLAQERNIKNISKDILHTKNDWVAGIVQSVLRAGVEEPVKN